jgi:hypothetical protein
MWAAVKGGTECHLSKFLPAQTNRALCHIDLYLYISLYIKDLSRFWRVLTTVCNTQNYWGFGLFLSFEILQTRKHVSNIRSVSFLKWGEEGIYSFGSLRNSPVIEFNSGSRKQRLTAVEIRCADHSTPSIHKSWDQIRRQAAVARSV